MKQPKDKNFGKSPFDPDYRDDYDEDAEYDAYLQAVEEREQFKKENR